MASNDMDNEEDIFKGSDSDDIQYKPRIIRTFKVGFTAVTSMASFIDYDMGHCTVICNNKANEFTFCDKDGEIILKRVGTNGVQVIQIAGYYSAAINDISESNYNNEFLVTLWQPGSEQKVSKSSLTNNGMYLDTSWNSLPNSEQVIITGVCQVQNGNLVTLNVSEHSHELTSSSRRFVKNEVSGLVIEYKMSTGNKSHMEGQQMLFTYPKRIVESDLGDLWIVDRKSPHTGDVKVCDTKDGRLKFVYGGGPVGAQFDPSDIAANKTDVLVISDCSNHLVHLVRNDGAFIQYIMTAQQGLQYPTSICVNRFQHAWVGCRDGTVHILQYIPDFE